MPFIVSNCSFKLKFRSDIVNKPCQTMCGGEIMCKMLYVSKWETKRQTIEDPIEISFQCSGESDFLCENWWMHCKGKGKGKGKGECWTFVFCVERFTIPQCCLYLFCIFQAYPIKSIGNYNNN